MGDLERVIGIALLLPPGIEVSPMRAREYAFRQSGLREQARVSTDPTYYEQNADTVELWSPGNPTFPELASAFPTPIYWDERSLRRNRANRRRAFLIG
jgi:hypothetical protein